MRSLDFYLDEAKKKSGCESDRDLMKLLKLSSATASHWRTKRSWPRDDQMIEIAKLAGISREQALLELSYWRSEGEAQEGYKELIKRLGATVAAVLIAVFLLSSTAHASPTHHMMSKGVYIMEIIRRIKKRLHTAIPHVFNRIFNLLRHNRHLGYFCDRSGATTSSYA